LVSEVAALFRSAREHGSAGLAFSQNNQLIHAAAFRLFFLDLAY